jgi:hypothetical protein
MEPTVTPPAAVPPGVTLVQPGAPPAAPPATPPAAADIPAAEAPQKWNWLMIGGFILLGVVGLSAIYFFRQRTFEQSNDSKEKDRKITNLQSEMNKLKQQVQP